MESWYLSQALSEQELQESHKWKQWQVEENYGHRSHLLHTLALPAACQHVSGCFPACFGCFPESPTNKVRICYCYVSSEADASGIAVRAPEMNLTYAELRKAVHHLASELVDARAPGFRVAVAMLKGWEEVVACLGTLQCGASYVPLEITDGRWPSVLRKADCHMLLMTPASRRESENALRQLDIQLKEIGMEWLHQALQAPESPQNHLEISTSDTAYIIFTSGSTGEPKGVAISHHSASNTCISVNELVRLNKTDRVPSFMLSLAWRQRV